MGYIELGLIFVKKILTDFIPADLGFYADGQSVILSEKLHIYPFSITFANNEDDAMSGSGFLWDTQSHFFSRILNIVS